MITGTSCMLLPKGKATTTINTLSLVLFYLRISFNHQVRMTLGDEDSGRGLQLVPGSHGQNVSNTCTIVIIAGKKNKKNMKKKKF